LSYQHRIRVRYADCDPQSVVYNAHYLTFIDDAFDTWVRTVRPGGFEGGGLDIMVKRADLTWHAAATIGDIIELDVAVSRWGTTSLDVSTVATVAGRALFDSVLTYVMVRLHTTSPVVIPDEVRALFSS
jgi:acyl-CoA thioester hydrolase